MNQKRKSPGGGSEGAFAQLIASVVAARIAQRRAAIQVEFDVDALAPMPSDPAAVSQLVRQLVDQAIDGMQGRGDLTITLWQNAGQLELELADSGVAVEQRPRRLSMLAASLGAQLRWQNCPQGGAAVTVRLEDATRHRAAA